MQLALSVSDAVKYCSFGNPLDALVVCSTGLDYFCFYWELARTAMWPPLPYMDVICSWQWARKCGHITGDLYQSVSIWNIWVPYQSETDSPCWMQQIFALWRNKAPLWNSFSFLCCLMTPRQSIGCWLFAPQPLIPDQLLPNSPHAFPTVYHCVTETAVFNSACATRRLQKLLTIERIYIGFTLCYFNLTVFYLWCIFLSVFNSVAVSRFSFSFALPSLRIFLSVFNSVAVSRSSFSFALLSLLYLYLLSFSSSFFL